MAIPINEITPKLREVSWALSKSASKLKELVFDPAYRLAGRMAAEDRIEQEVKKIPNRVIFYAGMNRPNYPPSSQFHEPLSQEAIESANEALRNYNSSVLIENNYNMLQARMKFNHAVEPLKDTLSWIINLATTQPKLFTKPILYKEEAEVLAEIFSVMEEETSKNITISITPGLDANIVIVDEPYSRAYGNVVKTFKRLAHICSPLPANKGKRTKNVA